MKKTHPKSEIRRLWQNGLDEVEQYKVILQMEQVPPKQSLYPVYVVEYIEPKDYNDDLIVEKLEPCISSTRDSIHESFIDDYGRLRSMMSTHSDDVAHSYIEAMCDVLEFCIAERDSINRMDDEGIRKMKPSDVSKLVDVEAFCNSQIKQKRGEFNG